MEDMAAEAAVAAEVARGGSGSAEIKRSSVRESGVQGRGGGSDDDGGGYDKKVSIGITGSVVLQVVYLLVGVSTCWFLLEPIIADPSFILICSRRANHRATSHVLFASLFFGRIHRDRPGEVPVV